MCSWQSIPSRVVRVRTYSTAPKECLYMTRALSFPTRRAKAARFCPTPGVKMAVLVQEGRWPNPLGFQHAPLTVRATLKQMERRR